MRRWWLAMTMMAIIACGGEPDAPPAEPAPVPGPIDPAMPGKVEPTPTSEVAFGRAVVEALRRDDWDGYTNLLATRADMMGLFGDEDRSEGRDRRKRRRMVWRRVNRLRQDEAEDGWKTTRKEAAREGLVWDAVRLVDVRREASEGGPFPEGVEASKLTLVLEHGGREWLLSLGTCARAKRGWVATYAMQWRGSRTAEPDGESLLGREPAPAPPP